MKSRQEKIIQHISFTVVILLISLGISACTNIPKTSGNTQNLNQQNVASTANFDSLNGSQHLMKFNNVDELRNFLALQESNTVSDNGRGISITESATVGSAPASAPVAKAEATSISTSSGTAGAVDYSQTNVQIAGVDEADFVKNDDRYIYMISGTSLVIVDALDAKNAKIVSETKIGSDSKNVDYCSPQGRELFVSGDKLVLFVEDCEKAFYFEKYNIMPIPTTKQKTVAYVYDISDRKNPKVDEQFDISGNYYDTRMIDNYIYIITQDPANNIRYMDGPMIQSIKGTVVRPDIYYFDNPDQNYNLDTITSLDLSTEKVVDAKTFMLGYSNTLMVSEKNIYIAYQKQSYWCWGWRCTGNYEADAKDKFYNVTVPLLKYDIKSKIDDIISQKLAEDEEWQKISDALTDFYSQIEKDSTLKDKYESMLQNIEDASNEYDAKKALERTSTVIQKINIDNGKINYDAKGEVKGTLLNQFSLDESDGNLRVATTINAWYGNGAIHYNNVYVLDDGMHTVGKLENIAENESIYSTRFIGDKLYMVTFKQVDPFFVIDLKNPKNPEVLGSLKIPGYSAYLHPYDESHIIGVGKETGDNQWGGTSIKGVKISLYDVSDFANPKEVDSYQIGESGTDSPVLYDHKAFLFSPTKKIIVLPVSEITEKQTGQYTYRYKTWHGAYVFKVSENGFELIGKIEHSSTDTQYYNWFDQASVMRSLYMNDNLYTISDKYIKINDLGNNLTSLNSIDLPNNGNYYGGPTVPMMGANAVPKSDALY